MADIFREAEALAAQVIAYAVIQKVAIELTDGHPPLCPCVVCRAAAGDEDALLEILNSL